MKNNQDGFIKIIVIVIVIVILLGVFNINLRGILESEMVQNNLQYLWELIVYVWEIIKNIWNSYFRDYFELVWGKLSNIFLK